MNGVRKSCNRPGKKNRTEGEESEMKIPSKLVYLLKVCHYVNQLGPKSIY